MTARKASTKADTTLTSLVPGISFVRELGGISEYQLKSNRLRILLAPDTSVPVAGCMVTYHVGSRNEATGYTGATHLLEHLMFKGSEKFNTEKGTQMDRLLERKGAMLNATTWTDRTNYYEVLPKEALPLAIEIEADRMRTAVFSESDKSTEMPVVRSEYQMNENSPHTALDEAMWAAAFIAHPYHHSTIGWLSDIEKVSVERLKQFYDDFYWPNNATVSIAGNFDEKEVLTLIKRYFGVYPSAPKPFPEMYTEEPLQQGQRRVVVKRTGMNIVSVMHKIPNALHEDIPALLMLATILDDDKSSRLYRKFVDTALATNAHVACYQLRDPGLFNTVITAAPSVPHSKIESLLMKEYDAVATGGVTAAELARAKQSWRVYRARRLDGPYALLSALNEDIATGDWSRFVTLPEAIARVTRADVKRVARTYLTEDQSTVGWFVDTSA
jgi:zinc protease